jgi:hypothetical protein
MNHAAWVLLTVGLLAADKGTAVQIDNFKSSVPAEWKPVELTDQQRNFGRLYQFTIPKAKDDSHDAEMVVFHFQGGGGSAKDNVERWKSQFTAGDGKKIGSKVDEMKVGDTAVTYADIQGTYKYKKAPFNPNEKEDLRPDYRLIGIVFESKGGPYFIRLLGPAKTVGENKKAFDEWLKGLK